MKITSLILPVSFLLIPLTFYSCGSDDDSSSTTVIQQPQEEDTDPSCLTVNQRNSIRNLLNRAVSLGIIQGTAKGSLRISDGRVITSNNWIGNYLVSLNNNGSWSTSGAFAELGSGEQFVVGSTAAFSNGCFVWDDQQTKIISTSSNKINFSHIDAAGVSDNLTISISDSNRVTVLDKFTQDGNQYQWNFISNSGGTTGGTAAGGTATGGTATGGTATGGTTTGGTTTGGTTGGTTTGGTSTGGTTGGTPSI